MLSSLNGECSWSLLDASGVQRGGGHAKTGKEMCGGTCSGVNAIQTCGTTNMALAGAADPDQRDCTRCCLSGAAALPPSDARTQSSLWGASRPVVRISGPVPALRDGKGSAEMERDQLALRNSGTGSNPARPTRAGLPGGHPIGVTGRSKSGDHGHGLDTLDTQHSKGTPKAHANLGTHERLRA